MPPSQLRLEGGGGGGLGAGIGAGSGWEMRVKAPKCNARLGLLNADVSPPGPG